MKTLKEGDWLRHKPLNITGILCQVGNSKIQLICFKDGNRAIANRWGNDTVEVKNNISITMDEVQEIVSAGYNLADFEVRINKRYVNLKKYLESN
jgi:hypothetical protein